MLAIGISFVACSSDEGYDADSAQSNYVPVPAQKMVASVRTTNVVDGREYSSEHKFSYDKQNRIKEVSSVVKRYYGYQPSPIEDYIVYREWNVTSNAKYYYDGANLKIVYSVTNKFPDYPSWDNSYSYTDAATLNADGHIERFVSMGSQGTIGFECVYKRGGTLDVVNIEGGYTLTMARDASGNVTGYIFEGFDDNGDQSTIYAADAYEYMLVQNKTNFDFSAYLGYWQVERNISAMDNWMFSPYQLAAFGFFGSTSPYLPMWNKKEVANENTNVSPWQLGSNYAPLKYTDPTGRVTEVTYVE